jgi:hypothetical protein
MPNHPGVSEYGRGYRGYLTIATPCRAARGGAFCFMVRATKAAAGDSKSTSQGGVGT